MRTALNGLTVIVLLAGAGMGVAGCGTDELRFSLATPSNGSVPKVDTAAREIPVEVSIGCNDPDARIDGYDVEYGDIAITVTFKGEAEQVGGDDCDNLERRTLRLEEPLGERILCDGSADPPDRVWPFLDPGETGGCEVVEDPMG